jgi:two-component system, OmpR family, sensor histidine kinase MprB
MNLGTRIGLAMTVLVGVTSAASATAAVRTTSQRLDAEIRRSIDIVAIPVSRSLIEAKLTCGINDRQEGGPNYSPNDSPRNSSGDGASLGDPGRSNRRAPRELLVQCLDVTGEVMSTSPSQLIPVSNSDRALARDGGQVRTATTAIDGDKHLVVTVPVADFGAIQIARQTEERDRVVSSLVTRNAIIAALATLLALVVAALIARRIVGPLRSLTEATEHIGATGDVAGLQGGSQLAAAVAKAQPDEVGRLATSFVSMLASLRESREAQARLVQDAGHELRTPLTSLRMNVAMLSRNNLTPQKRAQIQADVEAELSELTLVTNELVALASDTARTHKPSPIDLASIVKSSSQRWARRSQRTINCSLDESGKSHGSTVVIAPSSAQRILDNLLSNAVKFSPASTPIDVVLLVEQQLCVLTVRDHGAGIAKSDLTRVFDRFYRSDDARSVTGSGLGLSIVHDLVNAAGGTVTVSTVSSGGAEFRVVLPLVL